MKLPLPHQLGARFRVQGDQRNFSHCPTSHSYPTTRYYRSRSPQTSSYIFSLPAQPRRKSWCLRREHLGSADVHNLLAVLTGNPTGRPSTPTCISASDTYVAANSSCSLPRGKEKQQVWQQHRCKARSHSRGATGQPGVRIISFPPKTRAR